jgi:DoxX-like family
MSATYAAPVSKPALWAGRVVSGLVIAFLFFDAIIKVLLLAPAVEGTARLGYPVGVVFPLGIVLLVCVILYAIPRTSILGAILLTGYLGGATATQVRLSDPWFLFPVALGVLVWGGLFLLDERLRALIPVRS